MGGLTGICGSATAVVVNSTTQFRTELPVKPWTLTQRRAILGFERRVRLVMRNDILLQRRGQIRCALATSGLSATGIYPNTAQANETVLRLIQAYNARNLPAMMSLISPACVYQGYAYAEQLAGTKEIEALYRSLIASTPTDTVVVVDDVTPASSNTCAVRWHITIAGKPVPFGRGLTFYNVDGAGKLCRIYEAPEHVIKAPRLVFPAINAASPLLSRLVPALDMQGRLPFLPPWSNPPPSQGMPSNGASASESMQAPSRMQVQQDKAAIGSVANQTADAELAAAQSRVAELEAELARLKMENGALKEEAAAEAEAKLSVSTAEQADAAENGEDKQQAETSFGYATAIARAAQQQPQPASSAELQASESTAGSLEVDGEASIACGTESTAEPASQLSDSGSQGVPEQTMASPSANASTSTSATTPDQPQVPDLNGVWLRDASRSDMASYERTFDLMGLGSLQKMTALRLIEGIEVVQDDGTLTVSFLTVVPFFKVTEKFNLKGRTQMGRRDLRQGYQTSVATMDPNAITIRSEWGQPYAGVLRESFNLLDQDTLQVQSVMTIKGKSEDTIQVYCRSDSWRPKFKWPPSPSDLAGLSINPLDILRYTGGMRR